MTSSHTLYVCPTCAADLARKGFTATHDSIARETAYIQRTVKGERLWRSSTVSERCDCSISYRCATCGGDLEPLTDQLSVIADGCRN